MMVDFRYFLIIIIYMKKKCPRWVWGGILLSLTALNFSGCPVIKREFLKGSFEEEANSLYEEGNNYFKAKEYERAVVKLEEVIKNYEGSRAYEPSLYLLAFSYYRLSSFERAIFYGKKFLREFPNSNYCSRILGMLGEANLKIFQDYEAAYYLIKFHKSTEDSTEQATAFARIVTLLPQLSSAELEKLHRTFMAEAIDEEILYNLIKAEIKDGKEKEAKRDYELLVRRFPNSPYAGEFEKFTMVTHLGRPTGNVGVLLPLTGKFSQYGLKSLEIIKYFEKNRFLPFTMITMDTKSDAIEAIISVRELVEKKRVDFIIGPLFTIEALGVVGFASARGVPVIIPTTLEMRFNQLSSVFMPGQSLEEEARVIARYSLNHLNLRRFAVLQPDLLKYKHLSNVFIEEIRRNNGEIVAVETFDPDSVTLRWELERIKRKGPEAIFLSMDTDMIINTAPQVFYYQLAGVKLLGVETFYNEKVPRLGERYVESAVFAAPVQDDSSGLGELEKAGIEARDYIGRSFFHTLWKLREFKNYGRVNMEEELKNAIKGRGVFGIWTIRGGELVKLTEMVEGNE